MIAIEILNTASLELPFILNAVICYVIARPATVQMGNSTFDSNSTLETSINIFLQYFLPMLTTINTPLSLANFFVFLNIGFLHSPSVLIYFNLVIVDLGNSAVGIMISMDLWNNTNHKSATFWGKEGHELAFSYINIFLFSTNIVLVSGLGLIRVLWTEMSALHVMRKSKVVSWVVIGLAYLYGVFCCLLWYHESKKKSLKPGILIPSRAVEANDIADICIIFFALYTSIYTQARIWLNKLKVNSPIFVSASRASLIITLNLVVSYSFFLAMVATREYYKVPWNNSFTCPGDERGGNTARFEDRAWKFTDLLLCDELYLSVTFMCFQCTVNSFILISQRQTWRFLRTRGWMCAMDVRRHCTECCTCNADSDYEYILE